MATRVFATVVALLLVLVGLANAFVVPTHQATAPRAQTTSLGFGFLKELGLEKPSWLPDFGGSKKEETEEVVASESEEEEAEPPAEE